MQNFKDSLKRASFKHKNNKLFYYLENYLQQLSPVSFYQKQLKKILNSPEAKDEYVAQRVNYYNRLEKETDLGFSHEITTLSDFKLKKYRKVYFFDTYKDTRYFGNDLKIKPLFGDIDYVPDIPSITKSRPISPPEINSNSVLLNLDKLRHFLFIKDKNRFEDKKNKMIWRGKIGLKLHRVLFLDMYFNHPMCNLGKVDRNGEYTHYEADRLTIEKHLKYKFILCIEGNDVASNLKWVMSSNSLAVMPKPKFETWFMEGTLIPNHHYVLIKDDYSDLEERLTYYINHTEEAKQIIKNANEYVSQFKNKSREDLISILVLDKYFKKTKQIIQ